MVTQAKLQLAAAAASNGGVSGRPGASHNSRACPVVTTQHEPQPLPKSWPSQAANPPLHQPCCPEYACHNVHPLPRAGQCDPAVSHQRMASRHPGATAPTCELFAAHGQVHSYASHTPFRKQELRAPHPYERLASRHPGATAPTGELFAAHGQVHALRPGALVLLQVLPAQQ